MDERLRAQVLALLEQCDKEDTSPDPHDRYLYTAEIRGFFTGFAPDYSELERAIEADES